MILAYITKLSDMEHKQKRRVSITTILMCLLLSGLLVFGCSTSKEFSKQEVVTEQTKSEESKTVSDNKEASFNSSNRENKVKIIEVYDTIGVIRREIEYTNSQRDTQYVYNNVYLETFNKKDTASTNILTKEEQVVLNRILTLDKETRDTIVTSLVLLVLAIIGLIVLSYIKRKPKPPIQP